MKTIPVHRGDIMGERIARKASSLPYYIMSCLFFFGNIKFIKMILTYLGVTTGITPIAVAIFAIFEAVVLFYFLYRVVSQKKWGMLALIIVINIIYGMPYVMTGMTYELLQFCVFMVPLTVAAYLIIFDENGIETELVHLGNKDIRGCVACRSCYETGKCVFDDIVN